MIGPRDTSLPTTVLTGVLGSGKTTLLRRALLDARLSLGRVVTVIDAVNGAETLARFAEAARQAAMADALVISKTDLAPVSAELNAAISALNPNAARIIGQEADDPAFVLFSPH